MKENEFHLLVWKNLKGIINKKEQDDLNQWLSQSTDNQQIADEIALVWTESANSNSTIKMNLEHEYSRLQEKIKSEQGTKVEPSTLVLWRKHWLKIAASLLFLLGAFGIHNLFLKEKNSEVANIIKKAESKTEKVTLADGTIVWLSEGSVLEFPAHFSVKDRDVRLKGKAFFEVIHNPQQPFHVLMEDGSKVTVLGTKFNVSNSIESSETSIFVESGKVRFSKDAQEVVLIANQKAIFNAKSNKITAIEAKTQNDLAWQKGGLSFLKTPLSEVTKDFENHYDIALEIENKSLLDCTFSSPFMQPNLDNALQTFASSFGFKITKVGDKKFQLIGGKCR
jgi:transmembrane sensor